MDVAHESDVLSQGEDVGRVEGAAGMLAVGACEEEGTEGSSVDGNRRRQVSDATFMDALHHSQLHENCFRCVIVLMTMEQLPQRQCPRYEVSLYRIGSSWAGVEVDMVVARTG